MDSKSEMKNNLKKLIQEKRKKSFPTMPCPIWQMTVNKDLLRSNLSKKELEQLELTNNTDIKITRIL